MITSGIDIERVERFKNRDESFFAEIFTQAEIDYCRSQPFPHQHFCGIYCAKEALAKALNGRVASVAYRELEVSHNAVGCPYFVQTAVLKDMEITLSISHTIDTAVASVFILSK